VIPIGRWSALSGDDEVKDLQQGMDFRQHRYRREVFLRFYEFHCKYRTHPGCVYFLIPQLRKMNFWNQENTLWYAFINGNTQNPVTSYYIHEHFPDVPTDTAKLRSWFRDNYDKLAFDTDRRYHKKSFIESVDSYVKFLNGRTQERAFRAIMCSGNPALNFAPAWKHLSRDLLTFGRLSLFSYLEYLKICGMPVECSTLMLRDLDGSRSHRNGLSIVLGRNDLDWHKTNASFGGEYSSGLLDWLEYEGENLLHEAQDRAKGTDWERDVSYFTLESALCTYKSWHRPNRRYANVYADMLFDRIRQGEINTGRSLSVFWEARNACLPPHLALEHTPKDIGVKPDKQNHYLKTGQVIMMDREWSCFKNDYNDSIGG
jgi:hypothetical protein